MNPGELYCAAIRHFLERNRAILPQVQLQYGRNERWFAREFALAMNREFAGTWSPTAFHAYADCEEGHVDISIVEAGVRVTAWEIKVLYRSLNGAKRDGMVGYAEKARRQLLDSAQPHKHKCGLFWVIYDCRSTHSEDAKEFVEEARQAILSAFDSADSISLSPLSPRTTITYPTSVWSTESWLTWGTPRP
jgi:hypothetical protein